MLILLIVAGVMHRSPRWVAPYRLPGSANGHNYMVAYLPGRAPQQFATAKAKTELQPAVKALAAPVHKAEKISPSVAATNRTASPEPDSTTGADALGTGNVTIALATYFPAPHPDLSPLPRGTRGDVVLDVVIGTDGKISDLKMVGSLGYGIDETVIATVKQWTFHPALQNDRPVASEQELLFHFERG